MIAKKGGTIEIEVFGFNEATRDLQKTKLANALIAAEATGLVRVRSVNYTETGAVVTLTVLRNPIFIPILVGAALGGLGFTWITHATETVIQETIGGNGGPSWIQLGIVGVGAALLAVFLLRRRK